MRERISNLSIYLSVASFALGGLFLLAAVGAMFLLNSETLPQTPVLLGPAR